MKKILILVVFIGLLIADILVGVIAMASSPVNACNSSTSIEQCGFGQCNIPTGASSCSIAVTFSPAFSSRPRIHPEWNGSSALINANVALPDHDEVLTFQAVNTTAWVNMTSTDKPFELYSSQSKPQANQRLTQEIPQGSSALAAMFCVSVVQPSQNITATLDVQALVGGGFTDLFNSNNFVNVGSSSGVFCNTFAAPNPNLITGVPITYRVVGRDGASNFFCSPTCATNPKCDQDNIGGTGTNVDCPQFGTIWLILSYLQPPGTVAISCSFSVSSNLSPTGVSIAVACGATNGGGTVTAKIYWTAAL